MSPTVRKGGSLWKKTNGSRMLPPKISAVVEKFHSKLALLRIQEQRENSSSYYIRVKRLFAHTSSQL